MAVFIELNTGDSLVIGSNTRVRLEHKSGSRARLRIDSSEDIERVKAGEQLPPAKEQARPAEPAKPRPFLTRP